MNIQGVIGLLRERVFNPVVTDDNAVSCSVPIVSFNHKHTFKSDSIDEVNQFCAEIKQLQKEYIDTLLKKGGVNVCDTGETLTSSENM